MIAYERNVYTALDFLGDVGSLTTLLTGLALFFLHQIVRIDLLWENHVINHVFKKRPNTDSSRPISLQVDFLQALKSLKIFTYCCQNKQARKRKVMMRRIERELDLARFIKQQIISAGVLKAITNKKTRILAR